MFCVSNADLYRFSYISAHAVSAHHISRTPSPPHHHHAPPLFRVYLSWRIMSTHAHHITALCRAFYHRQVDDAQQHIVYLAVCCLDNDGCTARHFTIFSLHHRTEQLKTWCNIAYAGLQTNVAQTGIASASAARMARRRTGKSADRGDLPSPCPSLVCSLLSSLSSIFPTTLPAHLHLPHHSHPAHCTAPTHHLPFTHYISCTTEWTLRRET